MANDPQKSTHAGLGLGDSGATDWGGPAIDLAPIDFKALNHVRHLGEFDRLDEIRVGAQFIGPIHVSLKSRGSENNHQQAVELRFGADPLQDFETVGARHLEVEQEKKGLRETFAVGIDAASAQILDRLGAIRNSLQRIAQTGLMKSSFND